LGGRLAPVGADVTFLVREQRNLDLNTERLARDSVFGNLRLPVRTITRHQSGSKYDLVILWGGTAKIATTRAADGLMKHLNDWQTLTFGAQDGKPTALFGVFMPLAEAAGFEAQLSDNIGRKLWMTMVHLGTAPPDLAVACQPGGNKPNHLKASCCSVRLG